MSDDDLYIIGIGASAGGLDAIRTLLNSAPKDAPATYVQFLDGDFLDLENANRFRQSVYCILVFDHNHRCILARKIFRIFCRISLHIFSVVLRFYADDHLRPYRAHRRYEHDLRSGAHQPG